jgi:hypothetical protein
MGAALLPDLQLPSAARLHPRTCFSDTWLSLTNPEQFPDLTAFPDRHPVRIQLSFQLS